MAGVVINRPARKTPWLLLAAANLSFVAGQVSFLVLTEIMEVTVPFPSFADVLYLATYPLIGGWDARFSSGGGPRTGTGAA